MLEIKFFNYIKIISIKLKQFLKHLLKIIYFLVKFNKFLENN